MNVRETLVVFKKELRDSLRDRRTWVYSIVLPLILVPLFMVLASHASSFQERAIEKPRLPLAVVGVTNGPSLVDFLEEGNTFAVTPATDADRALGARASRVILTIHPGFEDVSIGKPAHLEIMYDATDIRAEMVKGKLLERLQEYSQAIVVSRLIALGQEVSLLHPLDLHVKNIAPEEKMRAGVLALVLPMFLALWGAVGGIHIAVDVTAGEKERGTLESLLTAPVSRLSLVAGKFLVVLLTGLFAQLISFIGFVIGFTLKNIMIGDAVSDTLRLSFLSAFGIFVTSLILTTLFSAIQLALSLNAKSVREAQSSQTPASFAVMIPWLLVQFATPADIPSYYFLIPLLNSISLYKELILGIVRAEHILATILSSGILAWLAVRWAVVRFQQEKVLFRL